MYTPYSIIPGYCLHARGKTVVFFSNKVNEKNPHAYNSYKGFIVNINKT